MLNRALGPWAVGKGESKDGSFPYGSLGPDKSPVAAHDSMGGGKANSVAGEIAGHVKAFKWLKETVDIRHVKTCSLVFYKEVVTLFAKSDDGMLFLSRELIRVPKQILQ